MDHSRPAVCRRARRLVCLVLVAGLLAGPVPVFAGPRLLPQDHPLLAQPEQPITSAIRLQPSEPPAVSDGTRENPTSLATSVDGTIISDTVWTPAGSPYVLSDHVVITAGVTLTITPGVEVQGVPHGVRRRSEVGERRPGWDGD